MSMAFGFVGMVFTFQSYLRYIYPSFLIFSFLAGGLLSEKFLKKPDKFFRRLAMAASLILNAAFLMSASYFYRDFPLKLLFSKANKEQVLARQAPIRSAVEKINSLNKFNDPVAIFTSPTVGTLQSDALHMNWYNHNFFTAINKTTSLEDFSEILASYGVRYILLDNNWGSPEQKEIVEKLSTELDTVANLSIRLFEKRYFKEVTINSQFDTIQPWNLGHGALYNPSNKTITVSVTQNAHQAVAVDSGKAYINSVTAKCHSVASSGRLQINWLDKFGGFLRSDIKVFKCNDTYTEYTFNVRSPEGARTGIVFVSGHDNNKIIFTSNSLKY